MEPSQARALLLAQHQHLRELLTTTNALASRLIAGNAVIGDLEPALTALRTAFAEHNASEESLLEPILRQDYAWGPARVARMVEEHTAEHASIRELLSGAAGEVAARMGDLVEDIDAHMAAEERTFLSPGVLRDDVLDLEDAG